MSPLMPVCLDGEQYVATFWNVEQESKLCSLELSQNASHFPRNQVIWENFKRQSCTDSEGQHHCGGIHQSPGRPSPELTQVAKALWAEAFLKNIDLQAKHMRTVF